MTTAPTTTLGFGERLLAAMGQHGPLCVGLDPHRQLLLEWGLSDDVDGLARFCDAFLDGVAGRVAAVKPQSAFFERYGARGVAVLEDVLARLREAGTISVLDAKRGDIDSTMQAYAEAYLSDGSPLAADALTVSPYLGAGALEPAFDLALRQRKGLFVLALTSNPEGAEVQHVGRPPVAARVVEEVARRNRGVGPLGPFGLVVGATVGSAPQDLGLDLAALHGPILAPGVGAQGGSAADLAATFAGHTDQVLPSVSRAILRAGPDPKAIRAAAQRWAQELAAGLAMPGRTR